MSCLLSWEFLPQILFTIQMFKNHYLTPLESVPSYWRPIKSRLDFKMGHMLIVKFDNFFFGHYRYVVKLNLCVLKDVAVAERWGASNKWASSCQDSSSDPERERSGSEEALDEPQDTTKETGPQQEEEQPDTPIRDSALEDEMAIFARSPFFEYTGHAADVLDVSWSKVKCRFRVIFSCPPMGWLQQPQNIPAARNTSKLQKCICQISWAISANLILATWNLICDVPYGFKS